MLTLVSMIVSANKVATIADIRTVIIARDYDYRGRVSYIIIVSIRVFWVVAFLVDFLISLSSFYFDF